MGAAARNTGIEIPVDEGREVWESQVARRDIPGVPCAGQRAPSGAFIVSGLRFSIDRRAQISRRASCQRGAEC